MSELDAHIEREFVVLQRLRELVERGRAADGEGGRAHPSDACGAALSSPRFDMLHTGRKQMRKEKVPGDEEKK